MINKSKIVKDAQKLIAKGQLDKAISEYNKILKEAPNDTNTHNTVGDLYLKKNDKENAIDSYKKAADILNKDGFTLKAIALYKKVLNLNPDQVDVLMLMGKLNAERGMLGNANEYYLSAASYFSRQGLRVKALDVYKVLCDLNPDNHSLAQKLAELYLAEGFDREAVGKLIELAEKKAVSGELREARDILTKAGPKGSERFDFIRVSALIDLKENHLPEAAQKLEDARAIDPTDIRIATLLAETYQRSGRYEDAETILRGLLEKDPKNRSYREQLIGVLVKTGDYNNAWKEYQALIDAHVAKHEFQEAEGLIREFLEQKPDSIEARRILTDIYAKMGRKADAAALHMEMAEIYCGAGEPGKAVNIYRQLLEHDPENEDIKARLSAVEQGSIAKPVTEEKAAEPEVQQSPVIEDVGASQPETTASCETIEQPIEEEPEPREAAAPMQGVDESAGPEAGFPLEEEAGGFPPFDLGEEGEGVFPEVEEKAGALDVVPEAPMREIEGLDIFDTDAGAKEIAEAEDIAAGISPKTETEDIAAGTSPMDVSEEIPVAGQPPEGPSEQTVSDAPASLHEQLAEVDVYIKYGLTPKALGVLNELDESHPSNPEVKKKQIEICKVQGDLDSFVDLSIELADIYLSQSMDDEAEKVLRKAAELSPGDERLVARLGKFRRAAAPEERHGIPGLDILTFGKEPFEHLTEQTNAADTFAEADASATMIPGSVQYLEELAEADFYAHQGLVAEARKLYRRLLAADPKNEELKAKYKALEGASDVVVESPELVPYTLEETKEVALEPEEEQLPADPSRKELWERIEEIAAPGVPEAGAKTAPQRPAGARDASMDDELDAAFSEMDSAEEEAVEEFAEEHAEGPVEPEVHEAEFFDLAAELRDEMEHEETALPAGPPESFEDKELEAVFKEFKKGVEEQLGKEDYETHYNLGIAYKEMGMLDEALSEFTLAGRDASRKMDCASMLGLCLIEKGEYDKAIAQFKEGLFVKGRSREEYLGLKYDLATAYELKGDAPSAQAVVNEIFKEDAGFRDVGERLQKLNQSLTKPGVSRLEQGEQDKPDKTPTPAKKSKVSYL